MNYKYGSLVWNEEEGKIRLTETFDTAHIVVQLDALLDWIAELTEIYNTRLQAELDLDNDAPTKG